MVVGVCACAAGLGRRQLHATEHSWRMYIKQAGFTKFCNGNNGKQFITLPPETSRALISICMNNFRNQQILWCVSSKQDSYKQPFFSYTKV